MSEPLSLHARMRHAATALNSLPVPDPVAIAHSKRLVARLQQEMDECGGAITFARFMELALYAPGLGYYSAGSRKFGAEGDFVTAPEISALFSRCVANQIQQVLGTLEGGAILEVGAGSGVMAADILAELERLESLPEHYFILELSGDLRERQQATLQDKVPQLAGRVQWLDSLPQAPFSGVVVANELLDALPVHRFQVGGGGVDELYVTCGKDGFRWERGLISSEPLAERLERNAVQLPVGYRSEIGLAAERWLRSVGAILERGLVLLIDYGFPAHEYYHPQRDGGTVMCHYRHRAHPDPLILPGLQDITAHVNFTAVAETAVDVGMEIYGYTTQAYFLLANGLEQAMRDLPDDPLALLELSRQIKILTLPEEMGELFKVIGVGKGLAGVPLNGFMLRDLRGKL